MSTERERATATLNTDGAHADVVLAELLRCALSWEPEARIIGNIRAEDVARVAAVAIERGNELRRIQWHR